MRKIPTLFVRDESDRRRVLPVVTPGCAWVLAGEGQATRKYDGACVMRDDQERWWARREVKPGKETPSYFVAVESDETTGKTVGWEPIGHSGFARWHQAAVEFEDAQAVLTVWLVGTYELVGPRINKNPERLDEHRLMPHALAVRVNVPDLTFEGIRETVLTARVQTGAEGIVWHHADGRMAKIKARDFQ